jgi:hypothetical protein
MPKRTALSSKRTGFSMQKNPIKAKIGSKRAIRRLEIATGNTDLGQYRNWKVEIRNWKLATLFSNFQSPFSNFYFPKEW